MMIEKLFAMGVMTIGLSRHDPDRQVGVFAPGVIENAAATRSREMERLSWIGGEWRFENAVPATAHNPAYIEAGTVRYSICEGWVAPSRQTRV
jgi:hypothetical protein